MKTAFFIATISLTLLLTTSLPLPQQLNSLLSLKSSLNIHDWGDSVSPHWCSWPGVTCDPRGENVISLDLSRRNLSGAIAPEIRHLLWLRHLNLSGNALAGRLPSTIFDLKSLRTLDVSRNLFNYSFTPGVSKLRHLATLNVYSNSFTGSLPVEVSEIGSLEYLNLGGSYFEGEIPSGYGKLQNLTFLYLAGNALSGPIPSFFESLAKLERVEIGYNVFSGGVPPGFGKLSNLKYLDISSANLSGGLTPELGNLSNLETLLLFKNRFSGTIPENFGNLKAIKSIDLSDNILSGPIPSEISSLKELNSLSLMNNKLGGEVPDSIAELTNLETLYLWNNSLTGILPSNLGKYQILNKLDVSSNYLTGPVPQHICHGNKLVKLILFSNNFTGEIPSTLANCTSLVRFRVQNNSFNGSIPIGFGSLPDLTYMDLSKNDFSGPLPVDFGNATKLEYLNVSENSFYATLPSNIWKAPKLQIFSATSSKLEGNVPDFLGCKSVYKIELEGNFLNGSIPWDIGHCSKLICLNLRHNSLSGIIPWEISTLPVITDLDLSYNNLSGEIPSSFDNCTTIEGFNVSYNSLTGSIPSLGTVFRNLHPSSFLGNDGLCGEVLGRPCTGSSDSATATAGGNGRSRRPAGIFVVVAAFGIGFFLMLAGSRYFYANYRRRFGGESETGAWKLTAFRRLNFTAEDVLECVTATDKIVGMGSTGTVYKAEMPGGEIIAVKKLWGKHKETVRRRKGVLAEVEVLGKIRHRNIVRLLGCCSDSECTMLLYEYMTNGSLDDLLHGTSKGDGLMTDWVVRYKIALGVAQGICYLHHDCDPVIVHRDLKPSNILLDGEMEARVADFGVAKLIQSDESMSVIAGSYGYIAPEYAYTLQVDEKSDIYSYGVVLMEILSGKRSVDSEFGDGNSIVDWVRSKIKTKDGLVAILDKNAGASCASVREEMMLLLRVALLCTSRNPADRPSMRDVVSMLLEAKPKRKAAGGGGGDDKAVSVGGGSGHLSLKATVEC